jgi:hypothetical protein
MVLRSGNSAAQSKQGQARDSVHDICKMSADSSKQSGSSQHKSQKSTPKSKISTSRLEEERNDIFNDSLIKDNININNNSTQKPSSFL